MVRHWKIKVDGRVCGKLDNPYVVFLHVLGFIQRAPHRGESGARRAEPTTRTPRLWPSHTPDGLAMDHSYPKAVVRGLVGSCLRSAVGADWSLEPSIDCGVRPGM